MKKKDPKEVAIKCLEQMIQEKETKFHNYSYILRNSRDHYRSEEYLDLTESLGEEIERLEDAIAILKDIN